MSDMYQWKLLVNNCIFSCWRKASSVAVSWSADGKLIVLGFMWMQTVREWSVREPAVTVSTRWAPGLVRHTDVVVPRSVGSLH